MEKTEFAKTKIKQEGVIWLKIKKIKIGLNGLWLLCRTDQKETLIWILKEVLMSAGCA